jgi:hypothetical protein
MQLNNRQLKKSNAKEFNQARAHEIEKKRLIEQDKINDPEKYSKVRSVQDSKIVEQNMSFPTALALSAKCLKEIRASK